MKKLFFIFIIFCFSFNDLKGMDKKKSKRKIKKELRIKKFIRLFNLLPAEIAETIMSQVLEEHINTITIKNKLKKTHKKMGPLTKKFFLYLFSTRIMTTKKEIKSIYILTSPNIKRFIKSFAYQVFKVCKSNLIIPASCLEKIKSAYPDIGEIIDYKYSLWALIASKQTNYDDLTSKNIQNLEGLDFLITQQGFPTRSLNFSNNSITFLPPLLKNFSIIEALNLSVNNLTTLPPHIENLSNLKILILSNNKIVKLPKELGNLCKLKRLYLALNKIKKLPPELGNLSNLKILNLTGNKLITLPSELGNLSCLTQLYLAFNKLQTLPQSFKKLRTLQILNLNDNRLTNDLDIQLFVNLPLKKLILNHNNFNKEKKKEIRKVLSKKLKKNLTL